MLDYKDFKRIERLNDIIDGYQIDNPLAEFLIHIKNSAYSKKFEGEFTYYNYSGVAMFYRLSIGKANLPWICNNFYKRFDKFYIDTYNERITHLEYFGYQSNFIDRYLEDLKLDM